MKTSLIFASVVAIAISAGSASAGTYNVATAVGSPGAKVMLNPQPLPPKESVRISRPGSHVMLNPQPLPPKEIGLKR